MEETTGVDAAETIFVCNYLLYHVRHCVTSPLRDARCSDTFPLIWDWIIKTLTVNIAPQHTQAHLRNNSPESKDTCSMAYWLFAPFVLLCSKQRWRNASVCEHTKKKIQKKQRLSFFRSTKPLHFHMLLLIFPCQKLSSIKKKRAFNNERSPMRPSKHLRTLLATIVKGYWIRIANATAGAPEPWQRKPQCSWNKNHGQKCSSTLLWCREGERGAPASFTEG